MRLLLDTNVLLWSVTRTRRLGLTGSRLIEEESNEKLFSAASVWEIAIKASLRRSDFQIDPDRFLRAARLDFREVSITSDVSARVADLPLHHRDPFDHLVAQAMAEGPRLLTADRLLAVYGEPILVI